jgi:signal transduction histidine kinase
VAIVLLTAQVLAHGMTRPLRAMTAAARAMAQGDYSRRVRATSRDEVGQLAVAFNQMAADLAAADQQRRELIANVSHELRTPIAALQAVLENLVDGVATADPATLSTALSQTQRLGRLVAELLDLSRIDAGAVALDLEPVPSRSWWGRRWRRPRSRRASPLAGWGSPSTSRRGSSRAWTATACTRCW